MNIMYKHIFLNFGVISFINKVCKFGLVNVVKILNQGLITPSNTATEDTQDSSNTHINIRVRPRVL